MRLAVLIGALCARPMDGQEVAASLFRRMDGASDGIDFRYLRDGVIVDRARQFVSDESPVVVGFIDGQAKRVGRVGTGPGEYKSPWALSIKSDSLMLMESPRVNRYAIRSFAKGTTSVEQMTARSGTFSDVRSVTNSGTFFFEAQASSDEVVTGQPMTQTVFWRDPKGVRSKTLVSVTQLRGSTWVVPALIDGRSFSSAGEQPFMPRAMIAMSKVGSGVAVLEQASNEARRIASTALRFWDASGEPAGRCEWTEALQPLTSQIFDREIMRRFDHPRIKVRRADVEKATYRPKLLPAFDLMVYASDGAIWLRTPSRYTTGVDRYLRVDRTCKTRVSVKFDATVTFFDAKDGIALTSYSDDETIEARLYAYKVPLL